MATKKKTASKKPKVVDESPLREAPDVQPATPDDLPAPEEVDVLAEIVAAAEDAPEPGSPRAIAEEAVIEETGLEEPAAEVEEELASEPAPEKAKAESDEGPEEQTEPADPEGVVTVLSPERHAMLLKTWEAQGNPRNFTALGQSWTVVNDGSGKKFVAVAGTPGMGYYDHLSTGRMQ